MNLAKPEKLGRNDPCLCGSGKKYKSCCLAAKSAVIPSLEILHEQAQNMIAAGNFAAAEPLCRQMLAANPKDAYFQAVLGQTLCWLHRRKEGLGYLLQAAEILNKQAQKTGNAQFVRELSVQLLHWGAATSAECLAKLSVKLQPDDPLALCNLAACLNRVNRNAEALPYARKLSEKLPELPAGNILLAMIESALGDSGSARRRLQNVIERNLDAEQTARAYMELAAILDKQGEYTDAFAALDQASSIQVQLPDNRTVSRDYIFQYLSQHRNSLDRDLLQRWPAAELRLDGLPVPVFLTGFLRSGTTLTEQVLNAHPDLITTDESSVIHEMTLALKSLFPGEFNPAMALNRISLAQIRDLRIFYWRRMRQEYGDIVMHKQLVDKNALHTVDLGMISVIFPEAKILFAIRDPRDVCISCFMQTFSPSPATINLLTWDGVISQYQVVMDYWLYLKYLIQPKYLQLRYEDTVADFTGSYQAVFNFLGLQWADEVNQFYELAKGRYISTPSFASVSQPIYKTALARWRNYATHFKTAMPQLKRFLLEFGYPED
jgi:tetratricopeptide (TPR) repeat protein